MWYYLRNFEDHTFLEQTVNIKIIQQTECKINLWNSIETTLIKHQKTCQLFLRNKLILHKYRELINLHSFKLILKFLYCNFLWKNDLNNVQQLYNVKQYKKTHKIKSISTRCSGRTIFDHLLWTLHAWYKTNKRYQLIKYNFIPDPWPSSVRGFGLLRFLQTRGLFLSIIRS